MKKFIEVTSYKDEVKHLVSVNHIAFVSPHSFMDKGKRYYVTLIKIDASTDLSGRTVLSVLESYEEVKQMIMEGE